MSEIPFPKHDAFVPDLICHYTSARTAFEHILHDGKLKFSRLRDMADPFESEDFQHTMSKWGPWEQHDIHSGASKASAMNDLVQNHCKVACFCMDSSEREGAHTESVVKKGYARSRMWSQYGSKHAGVCLVFSKTLLVETVSKQLGNGSDCFFMADQVKYGEEWHLFREATHISLNNLGDTDAIGRFRQFAEGYALSKSPDYVDEAEFRLVILDTKTKDRPVSFFPFGNSLKRIIIGCKCPDQDIRDIVAYSNDYECDVSQMYLRNGVPILLNVQLT